MSGSILALSWYSFCKTLHLKCLTVFWIRLCLNHSSLICTVTFCYVLDQLHSKFWHIQHSGFSVIYRRIKRYQALSRHFHAYWDTIKVCSGLFRHREPRCNPHIFSTLPCSMKHLWNPVKRWPRHIQDNAIGHYLAIFRHITFCNTYICRNLT